MSPSLTYSTSTVSASEPVASHTEASETVLQAPLLAHIQELRQRILWCVGSWLVAVSGCFWFCQPLIEGLKRLAPTHTHFVQLTPGEAFMASFKFACLCGLGLTIPVMVYHSLRFISPGLHTHEKKALLPLALLGLGLFWLGVAFSYTIMLPLMLGFLLDYGHQLAENQLSISAFLNFCSAFLFATGLVFQLPLVLLLAALLNLVSSAQLIQQWKTVLVIAFVLSAVLTPSADPFSQVVLALALYGLYGFSLLLIKFARR